jgi:hypothetical protein
MGKERKLHFHALACCDKGQRDYYGGKIAPHYPAEGLGRTSSRVMVHTLKLGRNY